MWADVVGSTTLGLSNGTITFKTPYNTGSAPSTYPSADATVTGDLVGSDNNKYVWSFKNTSGSSTKLQIKSKAGVLTSPTITSQNGFKISITYTFSSTDNAEASIQIGEEDAVTSTSAGTLSATTSSTSAVVNITAPGKRAVYITDITITPNSIPATFAVGKTMISFSNINDALDFTDSNRPSGLKAYKVSSASASSVTLTEVTEAVAKNTGLILTGTAGETYNIPVIGSGTDISASNLLVAANGTDNVTSAYVLSDGKFHPVAAAGVVIPAGKAYLPAGSLSAHELDITFDNGDVTGIEAVETQKAFDGAFYNLNGQRVAQPAKGLYIVNGKKVVIK